MQSSFFPPVPADVLCYVNENVPVSKMQARVKVGYAQWILCMYVCMYVSKIDQGSLMISTKGMSCTYTLH